MENESAVNEMNALKVFLGKWKHEGQSYSDGQDENNPQGSAVPWTSEESYEWLEGNCFIIHQWNATVGKSSFIGTEIIGYDEKSKEYFTHHFDNSGFHPTYKGSFDGEIWKFSEPDTRVEITVNNPDEMSVKWEWKNGGDIWLPLCDRTATRIK